MPKKVNHDARREELTRAAWRLIAERGIDEVTVRELAKESGYSPGVLAHYFEGKEDLLANAFRMSHQEIIRRHDVELDAEDSVAALESLLFANLPLEEARDLEIRVEMSFWARSLQDEVLNQIQQEQSETLRTLMRERIGYAQDTGRISATHDAEEVLDMIGALIDGIKLHALLYPERMASARQKELMDFALSLLAE